MKQFLLLFASLLSFTALHAAEPPGNGLLDLRGTLRITSEPGRGTTVHLTIPRA